MQARELVRGSFKKIIHYQKTRTQKDCASLQAEKSFYYEERLR